MNVMCEYASVQEPRARQFSLCSVGQFISILRVHGAIHSLVLQQSGQGFFWSRARAKKRARNERQLILFRD